MNLIFALAVLLQLSGFLIDRYPAPWAQVVGPILRGVGLALMVSGFSWPNKWKASADRFQWRILGWIRNTWFRFLRAIKARVRPSQPPATYFPPPAPPQPYTPLPSSLPSSSRAPGVPSSVGPRPVPTAPVPLRTEPVPELTPAKGKVPAHSVFRRNFPLVTMSRAELPHWKEIGGGGEAVVYTKNGKALKVFRAPDDAFYEGTDPDQERMRRGARQRLADYPSKLPEFPHWVGARVVGPERVITLGNHPIDGYEMDLVDNAVTLTKYTERGWKARERVTLDQIVQIFVDLHDTITELHACGMRIGDFKPDNVLVTDLKAFIVDAESMAYGDWPCRTFTENYVDPQLCDPTKDTQVLIHPYTRSSDWYAYTVMLFQVLTNLNPYDGTYRAPKGQPPCNDAQRALRGISVFNPNVTVPNFAASIVNLNDEVQHYFFNVFETGLRERPRREMIVELASPAIQAKISRPLDPLQHLCWAGLPVDTSKTATLLPFEPASLYDGSGTLRAVSTHQGRGLYLVEEQGEIKRETGTTVFDLSRGQGFNVFAAGPDDASLFGTDHANPGETYDGPFYWVRPGEQTRRITQVDPSPDGRPNIAMQGKHLVWIVQGKLRRSDKPRSIAQFEDSTRLFAGERFALVLTTQNEEFCHLYLTSDTLLCRLTGLPPILGRITETECIFGGDSAWLFITAEWEGTANRYLLVLNENGALLGATALRNAPNEWFSQGVVKAAWTQSSTGLTTERLVSIAGDKLVTLEIGRKREIAVISTAPVTLARKVVFAAMVGGEIKVGYEPAPTPTVSAEPVPVDLPTVPDQAATA